MILISNQINPNNKEFQYWADTSENPYGGIIKYFNGENWVYLEEPIFQNSPAFDVTQQDIENLYQLDSGVGDIWTPVYNQIDRLNEEKADLSEVYTRDVLDEIHSNLQKQIDQNTGVTEGNVGEIYARIDEVNSQLTTRVDNLDYDLNQKIVNTQQTIMADVDNSYVHKRTGYDLISTAEIERLSTVENYDDTAIKQSINQLPTKAYVSNYVNQTIIGQAPQVLDTLEELAAALGNDPNFATTITELIGTKANSSEVYTKKEVYSKADVDSKISTFSTNIQQIDNKVNILNESIPQNLSDLTNDMNFITAETDPTVPSWAKAANKPTYTATEVGALPLDTHIPSTTSELTNDAGFITNSTLQTAINNAKLEEVYMNKLKFIGSVYTQNFYVDMEHILIGEPIILTIDPNYQYNIIKFDENSYSKFSNLTFVITSSEPIKPLQHYYVIILPNKPETQNFTISFQEQHSLQLIPADINQGESGYMVEFMDYGDTSDVTTYVRNVTNFNNDNLIDG